MGHNNGRWVVKFSIRCMNGIGSPYIGPVALALGPERGMEWHWMDGWMANVPERPMCQWMANGPERLAWPERPMCQSGKGPGQHGWHESPAWLAWKGSG